MELKQRYNLTEVGVIPDTWNIVLLGDLKPFVTSGSRGWASFYSEHGSLFVQITNLSRQSIYLDLSDARFVKLPPNVTEGVRTRLNDGDVLISITADIGIVGYVDACVPTPAYISRRIALIRFNPTRTSGKFVAYFLASENSQRLFRASTDVGAKAGMSLATIPKIQIVLPPLPEQQAIASALSDADALLTELNRLIAKKRDLKQAATRQLVTGETRLPGYEDEWEPVEFGEITHIRNVKVIASSVPEGTRCVELESIGQAAGRLLGSVESRGASPKYTFQKGDVLFGRLRAYLRKFWLATFDGICSTEIWPLVPRGERLYPGFLHVLVQTSEFIDVASVAYGTHMPRSDWSVMSKWLLRLPSLPEQAAIAAVLFDMDAELEALNARRDKTRALKQAMTHELLTGRTRLSSTAVTVDHVGRNLDLC